MNRFAKRIEELTDPDVNEVNEEEQHTASESQLRHLEQELNISLPEDFREFMRDFGGIWLSDNRCRRAALYHLGDYRWGRASVNLFYDVDELLKQATYQRKNSYIPSELMTIAEDGNVRLFLAVAGLWKGTIYQWYPNSFPDPLRYYPELEVVTRSFEDFLQVLRLRAEAKDDEMVEERHQVESALRQLESIELPQGNAYTSKMESLKARYVYSMLGEEAPRLASSDLDGVERELGFSLPNDYREFWRDFNGYSFLPSNRGDGYYSTFPQVSPQKSGESLNTVHKIKFFHGYLRDDYHSFWGHYERLRNVLPSGIIPIADGGDICLSLSGEDAGMVYMGDKKLTEYNPDEPPSPIERTDLTPLASSFDEFISGITRPESW